MTVEQKAAQLLVAGIEGTEPGEDAVQAIQGYQVGGVILFGRNVESAEQLAALTNGLKELNGDYVPPCSSAWIRKGGAGWTGCRRR